MRSVLTVVFIIGFVMTALGDLSASAISSSNNPDILFIHHSVGDSLIRDGSVRQILSEAGYDFWDHGYNHPELGLRNEKGKPAGSYWIPEDNTNPDGFANLFGQDPREDNALSSIMNSHEVIAFKSCFPASQIQEDNKIKDFLDAARRSLHNYKRHYKDIRKAVAKYPEKIFILVTQPPLHPNATNIEEAKRARALAEWLKSKEFLGNLKNLFVFDYFDLLADNRTNMLRFEYQINPKGKNSHPNPIAQMFIAPRFADFVMNTIRLGSNTTTMRNTVDHPKRPYELTRLTEPVATLSGKVESERVIKKIVWSDLKGQRGELPPADSWVIRDLPVSPGVTKVLVTSIDDLGMRASTILGVQYYTGVKRQAVIFDESLKQGTLDGATYSDLNPSSGRTHLAIKGTGRPQRVAIRGIQLDIADFDPETTSIEFQYDQGNNSALPRLLLIGIGDLYLKVDHKPGYEKITVPFKRFRYVHNELDKLVFRGTWEKGTQIFIDSIRIVNAGRDGGETSSLFNQ